MLSAELFSFKTGQVYALASMVLLHVSISFVGFAIAIEAHLSTIVDSALRSMYSRRHTMMTSALSYCTLHMCRDSRVALNFFASCLVHALGFCKRWDVT